jgi:hypothetical protein
MMPSLPTQPLPLTDTVNSNAGYEQEAIIDADGKIIGYRIKKPVIFVQPVMNIKLADMTRVGVKCTIRYSAHFLKDLL